MDYIRTISQMGMSPNFWCSEEYLEKSKAFEILDLPLLYVVDQEGFSLFPTINLDHMEFDLNREFWAGFSNQERYGSFLDYEYIYDPNDFLDMSGGKWAVFRKNSRKWSKCNLSQYSSRIPNFQDISILVCGWLEGKLGEEIYDDRVMEEYVFNGYFRKFLYRGNDLVGMNIWDENYAYINFRYCISIPDPFLNEYLRWLFYTDKDILIRKKLVNDGGVLDKLSLRIFKDKMNPLLVNKIYSKEIQQNQNGVRHSIERIKEKNIEDIRDIRRVNEESKEAGTDRSPE